MLGPALGEYNAVSHLVWAVIYLLFALLVVMALVEILTDLFYAFRNRLRRVRKPPTSTDPSRGERVRFEEPGTVLRARYFHRIVPVWRTWFEGRFQDPLRPDRPER